MHWSHLPMGFLLLLVAGLALACAAYEGGAQLWAMGTLVLVLAVLSTIATSRGTRRRRVEPESDTKWDPAAAPRLGEMLVDYGLITAEDLENALARQRDTEKRLGQVLVEMELTTYEQVAQVLEEQLSRREGRLLWGAGARLVE